MDMNEEESDRLIGASEFCALLNSDSTSPNALYHALKRFSRTARQQRLPEEEVAAEDTSDEEEEEEEEEARQGEPPNKKYRKNESWKEDTASYNVPFVGTSVAIGLDDVVPGEWPTGLMKAYLDKSPLAVELTGETFFPGSKLFMSLSKKTVKKSQRQLPRKLLRVYLKALTELVMAADAGSRFIPMLMRGRLDNLLKLLRQNASSVLPVLVELAALAPRELARGMEPHLDPRMTRALAKEDQFWNLMAEFVRCDDPVVRSCLLTPLKGALLGLNLSPSSCVLVKALADRLSDYRNSISRIMSKDCLQFLRRQVVKKDETATALLTPLLAEDSPLWRSHEVQLVQSVVYLIDKGDTATWQMVFPIILLKPGLDGEVMDNVSALPDPSRSTMAFCSKAQRLTQLLRIFPSLSPRKLNRQTINRGLQSKSNLVVYQTIVLLISLLDSADAATTDLHDVGTLLTILNKLDLNRKSNIVISAFGCKLVSRQLEIFHDNTVDWSKALPGALFLHMPIILQKTVIEAVQNCITAVKPRPLVALSAFTRSFQMLCVTRTSGIFKPLHAVTSRLLEEASGCSDHEATFWVDGLSANLVDEFCALLQKSQSQQPPIVTVARAWQEVGLKGFPLQDDLPSRLLCCAVQSYSKNGTLDELIVKVATQCLLRSLRPLGLAAIVQAKSLANPEGVSFSSLANYAGCLISMEECTGERCWELVCLLLRGLFDGRSILSEVLLPQKDSSSHLEFRQIDHQALVHQLSHLSLVLEHPRDNFCSGTVVTLLPIAYSVRASLVAGIRYSRSIYLQSSGSKSWIAQNSFLPVILTESQMLASKLMMVLGSKQNLQAESGREKTGVTYSSNVLWLLVADSLSSQEKVIVLGALFTDFHQRFETSGRTSVVKLLYSMSRLYQYVDLEQVCGSVLYDCLERAIDTFIKLSRGPELNDQTSELVELIGSFILCTLQQRCEAVMVSFKFDSIELIEGCLCSGPEGSANHALLTELVAQRDAEFALHFLDIHTKNIESQWYEALTDSGNLDDALLVATENLISEGTSLHCLPAVYATANRRFLLFCSAQSNITPSFLSLIKCCIQCEVTPPTQFLQKAVEFLLIATKNLDEFSEEVQLLLLSVAMAICPRKSLAVGTASALLSQSTGLLFRLLPPAIRAAATDNPSTAGSSVAEELAEKVQNVLETFSFDQSDSSQLLSSLNPIIRACAKYGMKCFQSTETISLGNHCISIMQAMLNAFQSGKLPSTYFCEPSGKPFESVVFDMMTSHSCFRRFVCGKEPTSQEAQVTLLKILISCMSTNLHSCAFDEDLWATMMLSFDASVSAKDLMIRQFLRVYAQLAGSTCKSNQVLLTMWGSQPSDRSVFVFPENLDTHRVRTTIANFPRGDSIRSGFENKPEITNIDDTRYSPAFVLAIALTELQTAVTSMRIDESANAIHLARSLQEKGVIGLCLASLSSDCPSVREVALSALSLMEIVVDSHAARRTSLWRDRPQLAMILRSTHKALAIKVSEELSRGESSRVSVPQLPGMSAIFLAKASSILSRPGDPLFSAVNRCFLQNEEEGGAFGHLGRLPIFVSLFCSSDIDKVQLAEQRNFAMHLIKDGMMTEDCYRLLTACYAPELLLSSVQSRPEMTVHESDSETTLLLQTLLKILQVGGERASNHLVNKLGLMSWLRSLLPELRKGSIRVRSAALYLVHEAVRISSTLLSATQIRLATLGMAQTVMMTSIGDSSRSSAAPMIVCQIVERFDSQRSTPADFDELQSLPATQFLSKIPKRSADQIAAIVCICSFRLRCERDDEMCTLCKEILEGSRWSNDSEVMVAVLDQICRCEEILRRDPNILSVLLEYLVEWRKACFRRSASRESWWKCIGALLPEQSETGLAALCFSTRRLEQRKT